MAKIKPKGSEVSDYDPARKHSPCSLLMSKLTESCSEEGG